MKRLHNKEEMSLRHTKRRNIKKTLLILTIEDKLLRDSTPTTKLGFDKKANKE